MRTDGEKSLRNSIISIPSINDDLLDIDSDEMSDITDLSHLLHALEVTEHIDFGSQNAIYGRDQEQSALKEALSRMLATRQCELILVGGESGIGKTALVEAFRKHIENHKDTDSSQQPPDHRREVHFITGKYKQGNQGEPYSAISTAFSMLIDQIMLCPEIDEIRSRVRTNIGDQVAVLNRFVPALGELFHSNDEAVPNATSPAAFTGFKLLCRNFLRLISSFYPIVFFLDDLHWADRELIEVVKSLSVDLESSRVMVIGAYRDDELYEDHPLQNLISLAAHTTRIQLDKVDVMCINKMIGDLTHMSGEQTKELANIVFDKTLGNPFHVKHYIASLQEQRLLKYDEVALHWKWSLEQIVRETNVSDNVAALISAKVGRYHPIAKNVLTMAACLGFQFDTHLLAAVALHNHRSSVENRRQLIWEFMKIAERESLVVCLDHAQVRFVHDKVQQALLSLVNDENKPEVNMHLGRLIYDFCKKNPSDFDDKKTFLIVDLMNPGIEFITEARELRSLADLNVKAGELATKKYAFQAAANYWGAAERIVNKEWMWRDDHHRTMYIVSRAAESSCNAGRFDESKRMCDVVLAKARSISERIPVYFLKVEALASRDMLEEAVDLGVTILRENGQNIPRRPHMGHLISELTSVQLRLLGKTDEDLLSLPPMVDETKIFVMKLSELVSVYASFSRAQAELSFYLWLRMTLLSLKFGSSRWTPCSFSGVGLFHSVIGWRESAARFGRLTVQATEVYGSEQDRICALLAANSFLKHLKNSIWVQLRPLQQLFTTGLTTGAVSVGLLCELARINTAISVGLPLGGVEADCRELYQICSEVTKQSILSIFVPMWQAVINLKETRTNPILLKGEAMKEDLFVEENECNVVALGTMYVTKVMLCCFYQDWETGLRSIKKMPNEVITSFSAHFIGMTLTLHMGLCYFLNAKVSKRSRRRRLLRQGRHCLSTLRKIESCGSPDSSVYVAVLEAEVMVVMDRDLITMQRKFDVAIGACRDSGFVHYQAFMNERAGTVFWENGLREQSRIYCEEAFRLYEDWEAKGKMNHLHSTIEGRSAAALKRQ